MSDYYLEIRDSKDQVMKVKISLPLVKSEATWRALDFGFLRYPCGLIEYVEQRFRSGSLQPYDKEKDYKDTWDLLKDDPNVIQTNLKLTCGGALVMYIQGWVTDMGWIWYSRDNSPLGVGEVYQKATVTLTPGPIKWFDIAQL
jgi:hypothetical protein